MSHAPPPYPPPQSNPYGPPLALPSAVEDGRANGTIYTPNHVALATFFGTMLAGSLLMAINEHRFGRTRVAATTMGLGVLATSLVFAIAFSLPDNIPSAPINIGLLVGMRQLAIARQQTRVQAHTAAGGKIGSGWAAFGLALLTLLLVCVPVVVIFALMGVFGS